MTGRAGTGRGPAAELIEVSRQMAAPPEAVFAAMSDAWLFPVWVVGATHVRTVDENWPAPGARMHHQVGPWPIAVSDSTQVIECEAPTRLVMQARAYPFGEARVELAVRPVSGGSPVRMAEAPTHGAGRLLDNPLQRRLLAARNRESLARLAAVVENRRETSTRP
jgi:uncharacterized protein YndB with AHSA1/START domain